MSDQPADIPPNRRFVPSPQEPNLHTFVCYRRARSRRAGHSPWSRTGSGRLFGLLAPAVALLFGCSGEDPDLLARTEDGWALTAMDLESRFQELYPDYSWGQATPEEKQSFLKNVVNNDLLVSLARGEIDELSWPARRRYLVEREEYLVDRMFGELLGDFKVSPTDAEEVWRSLRREALLRRIVPSNDEVAESCYQELMGGTPFEEAYEKYGIRTQEIRTNFEVGWVTADKLPLEMVRPIFFGDLQPGEFTEPVRTTKGIWILQLLEFRPLEPDPKQKRRIDTTVRFLCARDTVEARRDALSASAGYRTFDDNFPAVNRCFNAYWDSLSKEQPRANEKVYMSWRSPTWLLLPEHRELPLYAFHGDTGTAYDFMEELNATNSLNWPSGTDREKRSNEIRMRIRQLFLRQEAERRGVPDRPEARAFLARTEDEIYIDDYFDRVVAPGIVVTPEEAVAEYESRPEIYRSGERVAFAYVVFRPQDRDKAERFVESTAGMDSFDWFGAARALAAEDTTVVFRRDTGYIELDRPLRNAFLVPLVEIAKGMETGDLTGVVSVDGAHVVLRCNYRRHAREFPREVAVPLAEGTVRKRKVDAKLDEILARTKEERGFEMFPERLAGAPAAESVAGSTSESES